VKSRSKNIVVSTRHEVALYDEVRDLMPREQRGQPSRVACAFSYRRGCSGSALTDRVWCEYASDVRLWVKSAWGFLVVALQPIRRLHGALDFLANSAVIVLVLWLGKEVGWGSAAVVLGGVLLLLVLWEGTRREYSQRAVRVSWYPAIAEWTDIGNGGWPGWKISAVMRNDGADATFSAFGDAFTGLVEPVDQPDFAWEGEVGKTLDVERGRRRYIVLGYLLPNHKRFWLTMPASIYSDKHSLAERTVEGSVITLRLAVHHHKSQVNRAANVTIRLLVPSEYAGDPNAVLTPQIEVVGVTDAHAAT